MKNKKIFDIVRISFGLVVAITLLLLEIFLGETPVLDTTFKIAVILPISLITYLLVSYDFFFSIIKSFKKKNFFNEITLMMIASIAAFSIGEFVEGLSVALFFQIGEKFEQYAINKSRNTIKEILNLRPDKVTLYNDEVEKIVDPYEINVGDLIIVKNGERVAIDGVVIKGTSTLDTSSMTGESAPQKIKEGENIMSGVINLGSPLIIKVEKEFYDSTMSKMLDLVENASSNKTATEKFITKFSKYYTPTVVILAFILSIFPPLFIGYNDPKVWMDFIKTGASFLVISCPCALLLSVPMAYFVSLGEASKNKIIIKGSTYLEKFSKINVITTDKTGTLTHGKFLISDVNPVEISKDELLNYLNYCEYYSTHPIGIAIKNSINKEINVNDILKHEEISGQGVSVNVNNKIILAGNAKLLKENNIQFDEIETINTVVYVAYDNKYVGNVIIKDQIKESSKIAISNFYKNGIDDVVMLTGDNDLIAKNISEELNLTSYRSNLLPLNKVDEIKKLKEITTNVVCYVGDGVNDAPSLVTSDLGISMGVNGSDISIESSDAVIMDDDLNKINVARKISKFNHLVVITNITFALLTKFVVMILSLIHVEPISNYIMWLAIFADVGVTIICVLNSFTIMLKKYNK